MNRCDGCRYWSQMVAQAVGDHVEALCLGPGTKRNRYTRDRDTCEAWRSNHLGQVDDPPDYGERVRAAYEAEDQ